MVLEPVIQAPGASRGTVTTRTASRRHANAAPTLGGMANAMAFSPAVPGLAPGGFYTSQPPGSLSGQWPFDLQSPGLRPGLL